MDFQIRANQINSASGFFDFPENYLEWLESKSKNLSPKIAKHSL